MKINLAEILKTLGLPILLTGILASVLLMFGISLDHVLDIAGSMLGLQALFAIAIDLLKTAGLVKAEQAPYWSAGFNLAAVGGISIALGLSPDFNFPALDTQFSAIAQIATLVITFLAQFKGTQSAHNFLVRGLGQQQFQLTSPTSKDGDG
jgi:hypothetical protein